MQQEFSSIVEEGKTVARTSLQAALDVVDSAARSMASAVPMRRGSWLQLSGLSQEVQQLVQDLLFERSSLFLDQTDTQLHALKRLQSHIAVPGLYTHNPGMTPVLGELYGNQHACELLAHHQGHSHFESHRSWNSHKQALEEKTIINLP